MLIIGSTALSNYLEGYTPKDLDVIAYREELEEFLGESVPNDLPFYSKGRIEAWIADDSEALQGFLKWNRAQQGIHIADMDTLFAIKDAHKHFYFGKYQKSFKHLIDYSKLYWIQDCYQPRELISCSNKWREELLGYYNDERLLKVPSLNKPKQEFFNDKVKYYYDHDSLHRVIAYGEVPMYTLCLKGEVMFDNSLFGQLSYEDKMRMVIEESLAIALERCLIPIMENNFNVPAFTPLEAFKYGLVRVSTNLTSGPFREFAANNFYKIYDYFLSTKQTYLDDFLRRESEAIRL